MYNGINVCYMSIQHDFLWWIESFYALFSLSQCPCIYIIVAVAMSNCSHHRTIAVCVCIGHQGCDRPARERCNHLKLYIIQ